MKSIVQGVFSLAHNINIDPLEKSRHTTHMFRQQKTLMKISSTILVRQLRAAELTAVPVGLQLCDNVLVGLQWELETA